MAKYLRVLGHAGFFVFCGAATPARSQPIDQSQRTFGQKIARVARAFEERRTKHGRNWVAVFMNEDTIVITLHGTLTAAEKVLAQDPAGAAQVLALHRELFANGAATLHQEITSITGMKVLATTAEIEPTTGSVVHVFTTDTVREEFLLAPGAPAGTRPPGHSPRRRHEDRARPEANKPGCVIRG